MEINRILQIIEDMWDQEIYSQAYESVYGLESEIFGKKEFLLEIEKKLQEEQNKK